MCGNFFSNPFGTAANVVSNFAENPFTSVRDGLETAGILAGNYFLPGSSLFTSQLASKGSQGQLNSPLGFLGQIGTGFGGAGIGGSFTGIPASAGYTGAANSIGSLFGDGTLGTDIGSGLSSAFSNAGNSISNGLGLSSTPSDIGSGVTSDFSNGLSGNAYAPSSAASSAPGSIGAGFTPTAASAGSLGGGTSGGFAQGLDSSGIDTGNAAGGFLNTGAPAIDASVLQAPIGDGATAAATTTAQTGFDNAGSQLLGNGGKGMDLSSIFGGGGNGTSNLINGALRTGLSGAFNQNPYSGSPQIANTLNASAQQYNPYVQGGSQAQTQLSNLYGLNGQDAANGAQQQWQNTPGYQFQLQQGLGALNNSAAASGGLLNGNTGEALQRYGQGLAGTQYQQYIQNLQNQSGQGQSALGAQAGLQGQAAQLNQQPNQYAANQQNQMTGGLLASLFPQSGLNLNPQAGGGYSLSQGGGGILSGLSGLFGNS